MNWDSEERGRLNAVLGTLDTAAQEFDQLVRAKDIETVLDALDRLDKPELRRIVLSRVLAERQATRRPES